MASPFPVRVGRDVERVRPSRPPSSARRAPSSWPAAPVLRLEALLLVHAELGLGQVADVPHRGLDDVLRVQILLDRLDLGGRLHHHQRLVSPLPPDGLLSPSDPDEPLALDLPHPPSAQLQERGRHAPGAQPDCARSRGRCRSDPRRAMPRILRVATVTSFSYSLGSPSAAPRPADCGALLPFQFVRRRSTQAFQRSGSTATTSSQPMDQRAPRPGSAGWRPRLSGAVSGPGTASTSRPSSAASRAVMSEPLFSAASTTTTASDSARDHPVAGREILRQRRRPRRELGDERARARRSRRRAAGSRAGRSRPRPSPSTAMVRPPTRSAPRCAALSMPRASPLTMVTPRAARSAASVSATSRP